MSPGNRYNSANRSTQFVSDKSNRKSHAVDSLTALPGSSARPGRKRQKMPTWLYKQMRYLNCMPFKLRWFYHLRAFLSQFLMNWPIIHLWFAYLVESCDARRGGKTSKHRWKYLMCRFLFTILWMLFILAWQLVISLFILHASVDIVSTLIHSINLYIY